MADAEVIAEQGWWHTDLKHTREELLECIYRQESAGFLLDPAHEAENRRALKVGHGHLYFLTQPHPAERLGMQHPGLLSCHIHHRTLIWMGGTIWGCPACVRPGDPRLKAMQDAHAQKIIDALDPDRSALRA